MRNLFQEVFIHKKNNFGKTRESNNVTHNLKWINLIYNQSSFKTNQ